MFINDGVFNNHVKDTKKHIPFVTTSNSGNTYSVQIDNLDYLEDGQPLMIKFNAASTGAISLSVNGGTAKSVVDYFGNAVTNIRAGLITNLVYSADNSNFQLQGKGGGGDATAPDLLEGKKATTDKGPIVGTMPRNNGDGSGHTEYNGYSQVSNGKLYLGISPGAYVDVSSKGHPEIVVSDEPDISAGNIKSGVNIFGVGGTFTNDATAVAADVRDGKTVYIKGNKVTGTIPSKAAATYTPGTSDQSIASSQYLSGAQTIKGDANLISANIKSGKSIFGVSGDSDVVDTSESSNPITASTVRSGKIGFVNGSKITGTLSVQATAAQEVVPGTSDIVKPAGIYDGPITIKGIQPSDIGGRKFASGGHDHSDSSLGSSFTVSSLTFTPSIIYVFCLFTGSTYVLRYSLYNILIPMKDNNGDGVKQFNFGYDGSNYMNTSPTEYITGISSTGFTYSSGSDSYGIHEYRWFAVE